MSAPDSPATAAPDAAPAPRAASPYYIQSLERGLAVIRAFSAEDPELTLSDVARMTGMTRAASRRFLLTLQELGYVTSSGRNFSLSPRILELGYAYLSSLGLPEIATPHLEALVAQVQESASVSVLDGSEIVYVARVPMRRIMSISLAVGSSLPAFFTSMGRVLLAGLPEDELEQLLATTELPKLTQRTITDVAALRDVIGDVRRQGWCLIDQELEDGVRSVAAPITNAAGTVVAAVNVSGHVSRPTMTTLRNVILPRLKEAAAAISRDLGHLS